MIRLNRSDYNNIMSLLSNNHQIDQHDLTAGSAAEVISEPSHTTMHNSSPPRVNDAGAFLMIRSPHASLFSKFPNQQDDQYSYQPPYAPICASTIDSTAAAANPTPTPPNPTAGIIAYRAAEVFSMVADERKLVVAKGGVRESFPMKLFKMLEHIDLHALGLGSIKRSGIFF